MPDIQPVQEDARHHPEGPLKPGRPSAQKFIARSRLSGGWKERRRQGGPGETGAGCGGDWDEEGVRSSLARFAFHRCFIFLLLHHLEHAEKLTVYVFYPCACP